MARQLPAHWPFGVPADTSSDSGDDSGGEGPRTSITVQQSGIAQNAVNALNEADQLNRGHSFLSLSRAGSVPTTTPDEHKISGYFSGTSADSNAVGGGDYRDVEAVGPHVDTGVTHVGLSPVESEGSLERNEKEGGGSGCAAVIDGIIASDVIRPEKPGILKSDCGDLVWGKIQVVSGGGARSTDAIGVSSEADDDEQKMIEVDGVGVGDGGDVRSSPEEAKVELSVAVI